MQLIGDVAGYYLSGTPTQAGTFVSLDPSRILDTRTGNGATGPVTGGPPSTSKSPDTPASPSPACPPS